MLRRYVYGPGIDDPVMVYLGAGTWASDRRFYWTDYQGSVVALSNNNGARTEQHTYSAFGRPEAMALGPSGQPLRYTARRLDEETGLYYYRARYYSPMLGRFLQTDPIGYADGLNLYAYVGNDPVNFSDPEGLAAEVAKQAVQRAFNLVAGGYQRTFVDPLQVTVNAIAATPFADPGLYASLQGLGPQGAIAAGVGRALASGINTLSTVGRTVRPVSRVAKDIPISQSRYGEAATHIADAQRAGHPSVLTISRGATVSHRSASTGGLAKVPGKQLDEYPPAMFSEGGAGASVRAINPRDNMAAGACIGNACRGIPDGARVRIRVTD